MVGNHVRIGTAQSTAGASGIRLIERTAELGLAGAEPMIDSPQTEYLSWSTVEIMRFTQRAKSLNVYLPTTAVSIFNGDDSLVTTEGRKNAMSLIRQSLAFSALIGAKAMLLCTYFASNPDTRQKKSNLFEVLRQVEPTARDLGVAIALESPLPAIELANMVDAVESKYVGVYYDVGNAVFLGYNPAEEIEHLGQRILSIHVKDTAKNIGDSHLGEGRLDLDAAMAALDKINYRRWLIVETPCGNDDAIRNDIRIINSYL